MCKLYLLSALLHAALILSASATDNPDETEADRVGAEDRIGDDLVEAESQSYGFGYGTKVADKYGVSTVYVHGFGTTDDEHHEPAHYGHGKAAHYAPYHADKTYYTGYGYGSINEYGDAKHGYGYQAYRDGYPHQPYGYAPHPGYKPNAYHPGYKAYPAPYKPAYPVYKAPLPPPPPPPHQPHHPEYKAHPYPGYYKAQPYHAYKPHPYPAYKPHPLPGYKARPHKPLPPVIPPYKPHHPDPGHKVPSHPDVAQPKSGFAHGFGFGQIV